MSEAPKQAWTIGAVLKWVTDDFRARGIDTARLDAEVLLAFALKSSRVQLVLDRDRPLEPEELSRFRELVKRRRQREPVAYLVGEREFYGRVFKVDARVLVPRPETEVLVDVALARTAHCSLSMRALDVCTGSGCVAVTLARERPTSRLFATDLSADALAVARVNALRLGAYNIAFVEGDLYAGLDPGRCRFDLVVSNPPYIPSNEIATLPPDVRDFEPRLALDGGDDGLSVMARIIDGAPQWIGDGGVLALEVGAGEAPVVAEQMRARGFDEVTTTRDYAKIERVVDGLWHARGAEPA